MGQAVLFQVAAIGQNCLCQFGVNLDQRGNVATDESYMSSVPGIFAAGDMRRGQSLVVWAIAEGRSAARGVSQYLKANGTNKRNQ